MADAAALLRIFLAADSSVKAVYSDNSLFLLSKDGSTFSSIDSAGNCVTQLSLFAIKRYKSRLAEVVKFRNLQVQPALHIPDLLGSSFSLGYKMATVSWPTSITDAEHDGMLRFEADGSVVLDSEDTAARVALHPNQNRVAVCFPLLLPDSGSSKHQYSWQTQFFAISETPHQWHYPLRFLQQALSAKTVDQQPTDSEQHLSPGQTADRLSQLPVAVSPDTTVQPFSKQSWWQDCSHMLPHSISILLEWTPDALYQYIPVTAQVAVWIHADESCLLADAESKFVRHFRSSQQPVRLYTAEAVPVHTDGKENTRYPLAQLAEHAFALR